ncbi:MULTISPECIES: hydroxyacid dehydrogenase [Actinomycetes]|uniref:Hydroxyacid dehydrogenase n=2 Tax=Actinomycetes TaxID=1760 RepID=A0ABP6M3S4_9MICC
MSALAITPDSPQDHTSGTRQSIRDGRPRPRAVLAVEPWIPHNIFTPTARERLGALLDLEEELLTAETRPAPENLAEVEVIVAGWGCPLLDEDLLDAMPRLRAVIYTAGSVKEFATQELFRRGVQVTSCADINAIPVAEYTVAAVLFSGKRVLQIARDYRESRDYRPFDEVPRPWGNNGLRVGIVSASRTGRLVVERLAPFDVDIALYDPTLTEPLPGTRLVSLEELLAESDVVSLHAPAIPATERMIDAEALARMPDGATLINTGRGSLVDESALLAELNTRRLHAVIDVTVEDPPPADSPFFDAPNLMLTPHIAGSQGNELLRLGDAALEEVERYVAGRPLTRTVSLDSLSYSA